MPIDSKLMNLCTGCSACQMICPKQCISMEIDELGFNYPRISYDKCINCDLCLKTCPVVSKDVKKNDLKKIFAAWSKNSEIRWESTSGGMFFEIYRALTHIFEDLYVCAAEYDERNNIVHNIYNDENDIKKFRQSKYAQSDMNDCFYNIKNLLCNKKTVLFCGTPCQVAGLKQYLGVNYENLITIDFICRGVNSPKAYRKWLDELEKHEQSEVKKIWFKYKKNGWKKSPMCTLIEFKNGNQKILEGKANTYMRGYLGPNLYIRNSCGHCKYKGANRISDITLGDFWGIDENLDDNYGTSLLMVNSISGLKIVNLLNDSCLMYEKDVESVVNGNACFNESVKINPQSFDFLTQLDFMPFSKCINKFTHVPILKRIKKHLIYFIKKLGGIK